MAFEPTYAAAQYRIARTLWDDRASVPPEVIEKAARETIRLDSTIGGAHTILGLLEGRQARSDRELSLELRTTGYELAPGDPFVVFQYARGLEFNRRFSEAEQIWRVAIQLDPLETDARRVFSVFLATTMDRPADGLREIERAIEISPALPLNWHYKGRVLRTAGDLAGSTEAVLRVALDLDPDNPRAKDLLSRNYLDLGDLESARTWIDRLKEAGSPATAELEALYLRANGQGEEALQLVLREFEMRGRGYKNWPMMHIVLEDLIARGAFDEAKAFLLFHDDELADFVAGPVLSAEEVRASSFSGNFAMVLEHVYKRSGQTAAAAALSDRLQFRPPEVRFGKPRERWGGLEHWLEAIWHTRGGRPGDALSALERAVELGLRENWQPWIRDFLIFEDIRQEPRFRSLIQTIEADMARQREILAERTAALVEELAAGGSGTARGN